MFYGSVKNFYFGIVIYNRGLNFATILLFTAIRHNKTAHTAETGLTERFIFAILKSPNTYQAVR